MDLGSQDGFPLYDGHAGEGCNRPVSPWFQAGHTKRKQAEYKYRKYFLAVNITPIILTLIFAFGFIVVAYDQFALKRDWTVKSWMRGNSFPKLSAVFSIFMAPALAFYMLSWWAPIIVIVAGFGIFFLLIKLLKQHVQFVAVAGLTVGWVLLATLLVQM